MFLATLATMGASFISDMVKDHGQDLVEAGIEKVTGIDLKGKTEISPADLQKIKDSELKLKQLDFDKLKLDMKDRQSARKMQSDALNQDDLFSKRFVYYLAMFIVGISFTYIFMVTFMDIPEANVRYADTVLGFLLGIGLAQVFNFFFGSSQGSKDKTSALLGIKK